MKRSAILGLGFIVGLAEFIGGLGWCAVGTGGGGGSPLHGMTNAQLMNVSIFLIAGPLAILPLCFLAKKSPKLGAIAMLAGGVFSGFWLLTAVHSDGVKMVFTSKPVFDAWAPLAAVCVPMLVLGAMWLKGLQAKEG
ncbi:MAG: hypothetical protein FD180_2898 [Planctomycetota bacterium]|nr:MAG: hypothetical protein FD180_2898 [Planctomycetota bacterium]